MARKTKSADRLSAPMPPGAGEGTQPAATTGEPAASEGAAAARVPDPQAMAEGARRLRKAWTKADEAARGQFLTWLSKKGYLPEAASAPPIASGRYLLPATVERIALKMTQEKLSPAALARHLGFSTEGPALERALRHGAALRLALVAALSAWLVQPAQGEADPTEQA
ncbi:hypothetical protein BJF92_09495 [Rhizobium rhizosphaerae]|uniref:Uncharacterized protein n=1 Tax=Xaviernesmea rhizosphaerae TaxID=1672749 RepID=A0A1Q9AG85_9HYPH|nr:hypothetical protein [Xaviernesmea rhizosphaerae]OLP53974.1 hypothetical protein BJF92_09495 [Xaviernesmea rhizosphaerae]